MNTLKQGDAVPNFEVNDENGQLIKLADYKGKKWVVFFYPAASTPTCTVEACNIRDHYKELSDAGYEILGVSADTQMKQSNFKSKHGFQYPLIADVDKVMINAFGVWGPKKFMGRTFDGIHRKTFIINEKGVVERVIDTVKAKEHAAQILG